MTSEDNSVAVQIAELEADNNRLRRLLDQRDAPGELRHRLRNLVATLKTIIRVSAQTERDLEGYSAHLEDRLDALARSQAAADEHGSIDIHRLIADEMLHYAASEGDSVLLSGPEVELQPRAGQVFGLAIHELAVNAVEHGALGSSTGRINIDWRVDVDDNGPHLTLIWKERDVAANLTEPSHQGFGTEVLMRTLPYEIKASCTLAVEPDGLRCQISFPLPERIGRIVDFSPALYHADNHQL